jgi:deoxyribonuclease-4
VGYRFEHLAYIIDRVDDKSRVGVCVDTCHAYAAGYDLVDPVNYAKVWEDFDRIVGKQFLKAIHLNDSKKGLASKVDRHESLGLGSMGKDFFERFMRDERFNGIPIVLETPNEALWAEEIAWLRKVEVNG